MAGAKATKSPDEGMKCFAFRLFYHFAPEIGNKILITDMHVEAHRLLMWCFLL